jgi:hypothetical protein
VVADTGGLGLIHQMFRRALRRILTPPMVVLAAVFIFVEEWLWDKLTAAMAWVARWPVIHWMEDRLARLPAWAALVCFFLPGLMLMPVKIGALFLIGKGQALAGIGLIILAKVIGTAVVARFFTVCKPTLMGVGWFRAGHDWLLKIKALVFARLRSMAAWQQAVALKERAKRWMRTWKPGILARRWRAIGERLRRRQGNL